MLAARKPKDTEPDLRALRAVLDDAVRDAGTLVMEFFRADPKVWDKPGHGPVTEADLAANDLLQQRLTAYAPEFGWLSEESEADPSRGTCDAVWIVDPIDGTRAFVEGKPEFTICAGLALNDEAVIGSVFNPATNEHFSAARGLGASLNGEPLLLGRAAKLADASVVGTRKVTRPEYWRGNAPGGKRGYVNSIAYRLCLVAAGRWDACLSTTCFSEWDAAAAQAILAEAGLTITTRSGEAVRYNKADPKVDGLIASHPDLHGALLAGWHPEG